MKIEIKNRFTGKILFEFETENNSIKKTLEEAVRSRANLSGANLSGANLSLADLSRANLSLANLSYADLSYANLSGANLSYADLSYANLSGANLSGANLSLADLSRADLSGANLSGANLSRADLSRANLSGANLSRADLFRADLSRANLSLADLSRADLSGADLSLAKDAEFSIASTRILPEGDIIGYKKCRDNIIVKLLIPKEAKRSNAFGRKCRAEYADVLEIFGAEKGVAQHDNKIIYEAGKRVIADSFDENFQEECSNGIHFFITRLEAEKY